MLVLEVSPNDSPACIRAYAHAGRFWFASDFTDFYGLFSSIMEITDDDGRSAWPLATIGTQDFVSKYRCVSDRYDLRIPRGYARRLQNQRKAITFAAEFKSLTRLHLPRHGRYLRSSDILVLDVFARRDLQSVCFQP